LKNVISYSTTSFQLMFNKTPRDRTCTKGPLVSSPGSDPDDALGSI
jgi:hypothetical protein